MDRRPKHCVYEGRTDLGGNVSRRLGKPTPATRSRQLTDLYDPAAPVMLHCCGCHARKRSTVQKLMERYRLPQEARASSLRALLRCWRCGAAIVGITPIRPDVPTGN